MNLNKFKPTTALMMSIVMFFAFTANAASVYNNDLDSLFL